ncbi:MAG: phosphotransacetylase family protein [Anaerolineae bacterium]|nr:phosphotransacetylase family protein [Anaerolineae bacterium]
MDKLIIASTSQNAGKTSLIVGLAKALRKKFGYMKPLGDRLLYRKKQLWDYDSALVTNIFGLTDDPIHMSLGFDHSKLRYMYDEAATKEKLLEAVESIGQDKELLFIEDSKDIAYGISVYLDAISLAEYTGAKLIVVVSGDEAAIFDDITFITKHIDISRVNFGGVIVNKLHDLENFEETYLLDIEEMGIKVVGMVPYEARLTYFAIDYLAEYLFAKVVAGEGGVTNVVQNVFVGAASVNAALRSPVLKKEKSLAITSGDRTDMILAALESDVVGMILTNNILPPPNIIAKASARNVPLLLVSADTYEIARKMDNLQPLLTKDDAVKIELLEQLVKEHVNLAEITG